MPTASITRPGAGPGRFLRQRGDTSLLGGAWVGIPVFGNSLGSVTLDFSMAPVGEWMFACIGLGDSQSAVQLPTAPPGWLEVMQGADGAGPGASSRLMVYARLKQPGDTTFVFSWNSACNFAAYPVAWLDLDPVNPVEKAVYNPHTSGTNYATGTVTPNYPDRRIAGVFFSRTTTQAGQQFAFTPPPEMKERGDVASASSAWCILEVADTIERRSATGQTFTAIGPTSSHGGAIAFALVPSSQGTIIAGTKSQPGPRMSRAFIRRPGSTEIAAAPPAGTPETGYVPIFIGGQGQVTKIAVQTGYASLTLTGVSTEAKKQPQAGTTAYWATGVGGALKKQAQSGLGELWLVGTGVDKKVAPQTGAAAYLLVGTGSDKKVAPQGGVAEVWIVGWRTSVVVPRAQSGYASLLLVGTGTEKKVAPEGGITPAFIVGRSAVTKMVREGGTAALFLVGRGTEVHKAIQSGMTPVLLTGSGVELHVAQLGGRAFYVITGQGIELVGTPAPPPHGPVRAILSSAGVGVQVINNSIRAVGPGETRASAPKPVEADSPDPNEVEEW